MTAEYTHKGRTETFTVDAPPPCTVSLTTKGCANNPPLTLHLTYIGVDHARNVAIYCVSNEASTTT